MNSGRHASWASLGSCRHEDQFEEVLRGQYRRLGRDLYASVSPCDLLESTGKPCTGPGARRAAPCWPSFASCWASTREVGRRWSNALIAHDSYVRSIQALCLTLSSPLTLYAYRRRLAASTKVRRVCFSVESRVNCAPRMSTRARLTSPATSELLTDQGRHTITAGQRWCNSFT